MRHHCRHNSSPPYLPWFLSSDHPPLLRRLRTPNQQQLLSRSGTTTQIVSCLEKPCEIGSSSRWRTGTRHGTGVTTRSGRRRGRGRGTTEVTASQTRNDDLTHSLNS